MVTASIETQRSVREQLQLFGISALAVLVGILSEMALAVMLMSSPRGFIAMLRALPQVFALVALSTVRQELFVLLWAALGGALFVLGTGRRASMMRARMMAFVAGFLGPWGVLGVAQIEGYLWPVFRDTRGPLDRPLMTLPLLICALFTPWIVGRVARQRARANTA
jgi:hypothetical protein